MVLQPWILPVFLIIAIALLIGFAIWMVKSLKHTGDTAQKGVEAIASTILLIIGGVPLIIYPFILLANLMSLAGHRSGNEPVELIIVVLLFITVSSSYPLTYSWSVMNAKNSRKRIIVSLMPIIHLIVAILLGLLWGVVESDYASLREYREGIQGQSSAMRSAVRGERTTKDEIRCL